MAKQAKALCFYCAGRMDIGESFCGHCGRPSIWATHDERVAWEVAEWRALNGSKRQEVHTPAFASAHTQREPVRREETAAPARQNAAGEEIVSVRDYAPTARHKVVEPPPPVPDPPPPIPEPPPVPDPPPIPEPPQAEEMSQPAEEAPQPPAIDALTQPASLAAESFARPTTNELLEELVLLVGQMNERIASIERVLARPSLRQRFVAYLRRLYRAA